MRHVPYQLQIPCSIRVDHHSSFDGDVADAKGKGGVAGVETRFGVFEEGADGGEGIISRGEKCVS